jgi:hypothetical protein
VKTDKFQRKPFIVEAVQVTAENMAEVAQWTKGTVTSTDPAIAEQLKKPVQTWIQIDTQQPMNDRQQQAFVGDWVLYANRGFKIYTPKAFERTFEAVFKPEDKQTVVIHTDDNRHGELPKGNPKDVAERHINRSAESGEFVSDKEAAANPATTVTETVQS